MTYLVSNLRMKSQFRHVALIGKYQATSGGHAGASSRQLLDDIAHFLMGQGCEVALEKETATNMGLTSYQTLGVPAIGAQCDLCLVVGGDGTMLGIGRQLAQYQVPLIGINQGRLGFITDIPYGQYQAALPPMLAGAYEEDDRSLIQAKVVRDGRCVFSALAMNDVVVNRGATSGMVELRVEVDGHFVAKPARRRADHCDADRLHRLFVVGGRAADAPLHCRLGDGAHCAAYIVQRPIVLANSAEIAIEIVAGRDASANFDMQSLASLMHGDRIVVTRSEHQVRFLHPKGWTYFDTLRQKMHWNEGVA